METDTAVIDLILGLHPLVPLVMGIIWGAMKIADTQIAETTKAEWPTWARKIWDWLLIHVGESRNAGSSDAKPIKNPTAGKPAKSPRK
jgi:hypothetical protein